MRSTYGVLLVLIAGACGGARTDTPPATPSADPAPWSQAALDSADVPPAFVQAWRQAENRDRCALLVPATLGAGTGATARQATFSGGWGVAYDMPELRSAFGVAGTGVLAADPAYADWPYSRSWRDGSTVGYGPEGGTGPNQLAYLRVQGQACLYNVWSRLSREHLEYLLGKLRFVEV